MLDEEEAKQREEEAIEEEQGVNSEPKAKSFLDDLGIDLDSFDYDDNANEPEVGQAKDGLVGTGKTNEDGKTTPLTVKQGDVVIYSKYAGTEIKVDDNAYLIVSESDILAVKN